MIFDSEWQNKLAEVMEIVIPKLNYLNELYGDKYFALGYLTIADFYLSELSNYVEKIFYDRYSEFPFLAKVREAIESLPEVKAYYASEGAIKAPFFP